MWHLIIVLLRVLEWPVSALEETKLMMKIEEETLYICVEASWEEHDLPSRSLRFIHSFLPFVQCLLSPYCVPTVNRTDRPLPSWK